MTHRDDLKYKVEYLENPGLDETQWTGFSKPDGYAEANGPCPTCGGTAYGPPLPAIGKRGPVADAMAVDVGVNVDVSCSCHCGEDHGGGAEAGCGRWWIYQVSGVAPIKEEQRD